MSHVMTEKAREARARRNAYRLEFLLRKSRVRDRENPEFGTYILADFNNHVQFCNGHLPYGATLTAVEEHLNYLEQKRG
jgi:hypothetical protein